MAILPLLALAMGLPAGATPHASFDAALSSDDHCQADCALSARQLRGEAMAQEGSRLLREVSDHTRRRDISRQDLHYFKELLHHSLALRRRLARQLSALERTVKETSEIVVTKGLPEEHVGEERLSDQPEVAFHSGRRNRRRGLGPRAGAVQDCCDKLQSMLNVEWRRQARCSQLDHWIRTRLMDPSTPPFEEQTQLHSEDGDIGEFRPEELPEGKLDIDDAPKEAQAKDRPGKLDIELELEIELEPKGKSGELEIELELEIEMELGFCSDKEEEEQKEEDGKEAENATALKAVEMPEIHWAGGNDVEADMQGKAVKLDKELHQLGAMIEITKKEAAETRRLVVQTLGVSPSI